MRVVRLLALCAAVGMTMPAVAQKASTKSNASVQRGKYLVTGVGMCHDCHSPRNEKGEIIQEKWLQGSPLAFNPTVEMPWAGTAPPIAGLEGWTDAQAIKFFTTGVDKDGKQPRPPMPGYRFNNEDAKALVAYLRSLKPAPAATEKADMKN